MKALVRRLTSHHNLDRIDELDETDPFGAGHHHHGPYEAIASNRPHSDDAPHSANPHPKREFDPHSLHPTPHKYPSPVPSIHGKDGLSLHLEPGQILQHNTIYTSHLSSITSPPPHQPSTPRPDLSRTHSLPNRSRSIQDTSAMLPSFPRAPLRRYLGDNVLVFPAPHHARVAAPYVPYRPEMTIFPPPRHESRLHISDPSPPVLKPAPQRTYATEGVVSALPPRHRAMHSLDSSYPVYAIARSASSKQNIPLDPPRARHLPKRLVMPAPLHPQPPRPQYDPPPAEPVAWQDEYSDGHTLDDGIAEAHSAAHAQEPRLLRKKSSGSPQKIPAPHHIPMAQSGAAPVIRGASTNAPSEAGGTNEKTRRRRLSKRKNDI